MTRVDVTLRGQADALALPTRAIGTARVGVPTVTIGGAGGGFVSTFMGMRSASPDGFTEWDAFTDLNPYRGKSAVQMVTVVDDEFRGYVSAPANFFEIGSKYNADNVFTYSDSTSQAILNKYGRLHLYVGTTTWAAMATPSTALLNQIQAMCDALPAGKTLYPTYENEPSRSIKGTAAEFKAAVARFALEVKNRRGTKNIVACTSYTRDSLVNANNQVLSTATDWNVAPAMVALGLDPATDILMAQHGYAVGNSLLGQSLGLSSAMFGACFDLYRTWGFDRVGIGENAARCRTDSRFLEMGAWLTDLEDMLHDERVEFYINFYSGGSAGSNYLPDGTWIAGSTYNNGVRNLDNRNKIQFAQMVQRARTARGV